MSQLYYQLTGYQTQIRWFAYDDKRLAESIAGRSSLLRSPSNPQAPVELILGIKPHGTSHLLITKEKAEQIAKSLREKHPQGPPLSVDNFESLSPILFYDVEDLVKKISYLKPRGAKNRGDTSQANRGYDKARDDSYRGAFEHGRLLYGILNNSVDAQKYSIDDVSWSKNLRVRSFVFNTKGIDDRNSAEKIRNPIALDVGFCDATTPSLLPGGNPTHLVDAGNALLGGKGKKTAFRHHGGSDRIAANAVPARIQELFKDHLSSTEVPMILLVYHEEETINYIRNMGVDVSAWRSGLRTLLFPDHLQNPRGDRSPPRRYGNASHPIDNRQSPNSHRRPNSRSRSPHRNSMSYSSPSRQHNSSSRISSTMYVSQRTYAPVYVVDVRRLYMRLMQVTSERLIEVISAFGLGSADEWCAGNEAVSIIDIWRSMVSGVPIDEQRAQREVGVNQPPLEPKVDSSADAGPSSLGGGGGGDDSDDEQDPNDIIIRNPGPLAPQTGGAYSNLDESDYEPQSDDSD